MLSSSKTQNNFPFLFPFCICLCLFVCLFVCVCVCVLAYVHACICVCVIVVLVVSDGSVGVVSTSENVQGLPMNHRSMHFQPVFPPPLQGVSTFRCVGNTALGMNGRERSRGDFSRASSQRQEPAKAHQRAFGKRTTDLLHFSTIGFGMTAWVFWNI